MASLAIICEIHNNCLTVQENKENGVMGDDILIDFGPVEAYKWISQLKYSLIFMIHGAIIG